MYTAFIVLSLIFFALITWHRYSLALGIFCALLPTYLLRFSIFGIPTTVLEGMLWIIILVSLYKYKKNHRILFTKNNHSLIFATLLFLLGATIALFTSIDLRAALGEWKAFYIEPVLLFLVLAMTMEAQKKNDTSIIDRLITGLLVGGLATALFAIYQYWSGGTFVPYAFWENRQTYRVTAWYGFPNAIGLYLGPLFALALYQIKKQWEKLKGCKIQDTNKTQITNNNLQKNLFIGNWILFVSCILFLISSLLACWYSKSTGALVGIAASIGLLLIIYKKTRWLAIILGIIGLAGIIAMPADNSLRQELLMQDRSGQLRIDMWGETIELLKSHPLVGAGLASYSELIAPYRIDKKIEVFHHPHTIFMTMWVNIGLIGLIGFVWVVVWFYRMGCVQLKNPITPYLLASMTCVIVMGLVDSPYIKNDLSIFFWLLINFMFYEN